MNLDDSSTVFAIDSNSEVKMSVVELALSAEFGKIAVTAEMLQVLQLSAGNFVHADRVEQGILLRPCDEELQLQLKIGRRVMDENHEVLRRLAQS